MSFAMAVLQGKGTTHKTEKKKKSFLSALLQYKAVLSKPKYISGIFQSKRRKDGTNLSKKQEGRSPTTCRDTFVRLPVEVLIEIISHLLPVDVISLSRSSHYFRDWLMSRSSRYIWASAMMNIEDLPPCPPDMSEPYYSALLFMPSCTICSESKDCKLYFKFRLRLCWTCRSKHLMTIHRSPGELDESVLPRELDELVHSVEVFGTCTVTGSGCLVLSVGFTIFKEEANDIRSKFGKLQKSEDEAALNTWKEERITAVKERARQAYAIDRFLTYRAYLQSIDPHGAFGSHNGDRH